jgi:carbonic anhydrase
MPHTWDPDTVPPEEGLRRLAEGNARFREGRGAGSDRAFSPELAVVAQRPFAVILGCSDSRTPVEILFDQGFGDLFVVRVAGNVVAPSIVGSVEFAASQFGSRLVVVLGHTRCGAVSATVQALATGLGPESRNIRSITDRIAPQVRGLAVPGREDAAIRETTLANVRASADHLRSESRILRELVRARRLVVAEALYELETGAVRFL